MTGSAWRRAARGLLLAAMLGAAGPAFAVANMVKATDGYVYYNRPGADMARHDAELRNCLETWQGGVQPKKATQGVIGGQGIIGDAIGAGVSNIMMAGWEKARGAVNVEHCMVVRGWRVVRVADAEGKALAALDRKALAQTLAPWIGAETPHGQVVRVWGNEAAFSDTIMVRSPQGSSNVLLSSLAMSLDAAQPAQMVRTLPDSWLLPRNLQEPAATAPATLPEGMALVIVRMTGAPEFSRRALSFEQSGDPPPGFAARAMIMIRLWKAPKVAGRLERTLAFLVPAGKWRLLANGSVIEFCLGSPAFEVKAGQVVYMGEFNIGPQPVKPDLDLAPAAAYLGADSPLAARLRPAAWVNGSTSLCRDWHPYALEFEGFPYEPGYVWGGAARGPL